MAVWRHCAVLRLIAEGHQDIKTKARRGHEPQRDLYCEEAKKPASPQDPGIAASVIKCYSSLPERGGQSIQASVPADRPSLHNFFFLFFFFLFFSLSMSVFMLSST